MFLLQLNSGDDGPGINHMVKYEIAPVAVNVAEMAW